MRNTFPDASSLVALCGKVLGAASNDEEGEPHNNSKESGGCDKGLGLHVLGVGQVCGPNSSRAIFVVVLWPLASALRSRLGLSTHDFHVTLGFQPMDVHTRPKGLQSLLNGRPHAERGMELSPSEALKRASRLLQDALKVPRVMSEHALLTLPGDSSKDASAASLHTRQQEGRALMTLLRDAANLYIHTFTEGVYSADNEVDMCKEESEWMLSVREMTRLRSRVAARLGDFETVAMLASPHKCVI